MDRYVDCDCSQNRSYRSHTGEVLRIQFPTGTASIPNPPQLILKNCKVDEKCVISFSGMKSLILESVRIKESKLEHMIKCCCISLEELSLSQCNGLTGLTLTDGYELHKLRRLFLSSVDVGTFFSTNFASRFPCLKDLSILECSGCTKMQIETSSLETINFKPIFESTWSAKFDVPNIRNFTFSCSGLPSQLSIKGGSREWEFDISIVCNMFHMSWWFQMLKKCLAKFRLSRITLSIALFPELLRKGSVDPVYSEVVGEPLVVENSVIDDVPFSYCSALLIRLLGAFRPKFITHYWVTEKCEGWFFKNDCLDMICMRLMQLSICPSWGIPNQNMFGRFGFERVNLEVYEMIGTEWRPFPLTTPLDASETPANTRKVMFELIWKN